MSAEPRILRVVDLHTCGEPVRIVEDGYPELVGTTILEKRQDALERFDGLRRMIMLEPRGHDGMYGVIPTTPCDPRADLAVLFTHQHGYSSMCGHATIAIGRWAIDSGRIPSDNGCASFMLETPCGLIAVEVARESDGTTQVSFENVPSFAYRLDTDVAVPGFGTVKLDIGFGGGFFAILPASRLGLSYLDTPLQDLIAAGLKVTSAVRAAIDVCHPTEPQLSSLYGTILTDDVTLGHPDGMPSYNLCIFGEGQVDRSPTGVGTTARIALAAARGEMTSGQSCEVRGITGDSFVGTLMAVTESGGQPLSRIRVAGRPYYSGRIEFVAEPGDPFASGFSLPGRLADTLG